MRIAFSSAALALKPVEQVPQKPEPDASLIAEELGDILTPQGHNPFDWVDPALGKRLSSLNDRITFEVKPSDPDQVEITLKHAAHTQDVMMQRRFKVSEIQPWLDKVHQAQDFKQLLVVKQFTNGVVKVVAPFQAQGKVLRKQLFQSPFFQKGLKPFLDQAQALSKRQNKIDQAALRQHQQDRADQRRLDMLKHPDDQWRWF